MTTIAITGAHGFLGTVLVEHFSALGYSVRKLVRDPGHEPESYAFDLQSGVDKLALVGVDVLIHTAHDFTPLSSKDMRAINVEGSRRLCDMANLAGVSKVIFISSVSAFPDCKSLYGKAKFEIEEMIKEKGGRSVRPGLIYGEKGKGMFGALEKIVRTLPVIPLFDGGRQKMVLVHVDDLAEALVWCVEHFEDIQSPLTLASPEQVSFKDILLHIAKRNGKYPHLVYFPSAFALFGLRLFESIGLRLPFRSDSLVSLLNANPKLEVNLPLGIRMRSFFQI